jgi:orotate phosphoribosyltransferase
VELNKTLTLLKATGGILNGHFLLTSGRHSDIYFEKFRILENPRALDKICKEMANIVENKNIELVLGAAIGGILISGGVGRHLDLKHIFSERSNGKMELKRGFSIKKGQRVLIVEDIITTGGSVFELIELVQRYEAEIVHIVNLVDRSSGSINFPFPATALLSMPSKSWEPNECPLCKKEKSLTQRGRTGKEIG